MDATEKIYNKVYGESIYEEPSGVIPFLYRVLKKYEINRYESCIDLLPTGKDKLLDVGCGGGHLIYELGELFTEYYGIDVSSVLLRQAKMRLSERIANKQVFLQQCNIDAGLPFEDSFFDAISCVAVLEHVINPPNAIQEINRVLKPGGILVLQVPNMAFLPYRIQLLFGRLPATGGLYLGADWEHLHIFNVKLLKQLLVSKGFDIDILSCSGVMAKYRKHNISVLGGDIIASAIKR